MSGRSTMFFVSPRDRSASHSVIRSPTRTGVSAVMNLPAKKWAVQDSNL